MRFYLRPPALSTSFSESGKQTKKRFENIFADSKRSGRFTLLGIALLVIFCGELVACKNTGIIGGADGPTAVFVTTDKDEESKLTEADYDKLLSGIILDRHKGGYIEGECQAEGHIILDAEQNEDKTILYALVMYGEYGFEDGNFVKVSGSGIIPTKITLLNTGSYIDYEQAKDGSMYTESIKEMFPWHLHKRAISPPKSDYAECKRQERTYAQAYLDKIDRKATIGEYGDFEHTLLTDLGVSVEVSNAILAHEKCSEFPLWKFPISVGNQEYIENGVRYVYQMEYSKGDEYIVYRIYEYDTGKDIARMRINAKNGEAEAPVYLCALPKAP